MDRTCQRSLKSPYVSNSFSFSVHPQILLSMSWNCQLHNIWRAPVGSYSIFRVLLCFSLLYAILAAALAGLIPPKVTLKFHFIYGNTATHFKCIPSITCISKSIHIMYCVYVLEVRKERYERKTEKVKYAAIK